MPGGLPRHTLHAAENKRVPKRIEGSRNGAGMGVRALLGDIAIAAAATLFAAIGLAFIAQPALAADEGFVGKYEGRSLLIKEKGTNQCVQREYLHYEVKRHEGRARWATLIPRRVDYKVLLSRHATDGHWYGKENFLWGRRSYEANYLDATDTVKLILTNHVNYRDRRFICQWRVELSRPA
jgi:hypothetical protein